MSMPSLVHLLAVELRCVFISALSLCTFISTIQKELLHKPEEDRTEPTVIAFFCAPAAALLLAASASLLCTTGCKSFRSGEYIAFTSLMQGRWWYRGFVLLMITSVVATLATAYNEVATSIPSEDMQVQCCSFVAQVDHEKLGLQPDFALCCGRPDLAEGLDNCQPSEPALPPPPPPPHDVRPNGKVPAADGGGGGAVDGGGAAWAGAAGAAAGGGGWGGGGFVAPVRLKPKLPDIWNMWKPALEKTDFPPLPNKWNATWVFISYKWRIGCKRVLRHPWLKTVWPRTVTLVKQVGVSFILLLATTVALIMPHRPSFDVTSKEFQSLVFQRPWYSVVTTSNDAFLLRLQEALFLSDADQQVLLQSLLVNDDVEKARSIVREHPKTLMNELSETCKMPESDSESFDSE